MIHQVAWRWGLIGSLVLTMLTPAAAWAQPATPEPETGPASVAQVSPVALYDALLATTFPDDLLPDGVAPLATYPWQDSNDSDLAGAIGGVIFADGDPFAAAIPAAITFVVYPDASGADQMYDMAAEVGEPADIDVDGEPVPAVVMADMGGATGVFTLVDNVLVYGMAPHAGEPDVALATELTQAGIAHLHQVASEVGAGGATPTGGQGASSIPGEDVLLALAAAPFPVDELPFEVGELVTLPSQASAADVGRGLIGELLVRDAERTYPYPLVFYRVYADEAAARSYVSDRGRGTNGTTEVVDLPDGFELRHPFGVVDWPNDTTTATVQVGSTVVIANAPRGTAEERHQTALALAEIAVRHLNDVAPGAIPQD